MRSILSASIAAIHIIAATVLGFTACLGRVAHADPITITLDNPNQTVAQPVSGSVFLDFTGTIAFDSNTQYDTSTLDFAFNLAGDSIATTVGSLPFGNANNGGSISGILFTAEVTSTSPVDLYSFEGFTTSPALFSITGITGTAGITRSQAFSIRVTDPNVPEPSLMMLGASFGLVSVGFLRRRKRAGKRAS